MSFREILNQQRLTPGMLFRHSGMAINAYYKFDGTDTDRLKQWAVDVKGRHVQQPVNLFFADFMSTEWEILTDVKA